MEREMIEKLRQSVGQTADLIQMMMSDDVLLGSLEAVSYTHLTLPTKRIV